MFDTFALDSHLNRVFTDSLFDPFMDQSMNSCSVTPLGSANDFTWFEGSELYPAFGSEQFFPQPQGYDDQGFTTDYETFTSTDASGNSSPRTSTHQNAAMDPVPDPFYNAPSSVVISPQGPTNVDLDHYREHRRGSIHGFPLTSASSVPLLLRVL